jgi:hypothetical protein
LNLEYAIRADQTLWARQTFQSAAKHIRTMENTPKEHGKHTGFVETHPTKAEDLLVMATMPDPRYPESK